MKAASDNLRWNFTVNVLDNMLFALAASLVAQETILPLLVNRLGDSPVLIGLIPALYSIAFYLPQLFMANHAEGLRRKLPFVVVVSGIFQRLPIPLIGVSLLLFAESNPGLALLLFYALFALAAFGGGVVTPAWYTMIGKVIPVRRRGIFFGIASGGGMLMGVGGAYFVGRALDEVAFPGNFALLFGVASVIHVASWICLALTREPASDVRERSPGMGEYLRRLPGILRAHGNYRRFLLSYALLRVSMMSTAFFVVLRRAVDATWRGGSGAAGGRVHWRAGAHAAGHGQPGRPMGTQTQPVSGGAGHGAGGGLRASWHRTLSASRWLLACWHSRFPATRCRITTSCWSSPRRTTSLHVIGLTNTILAPVTFAAPLLGGWIAGQFGYSALFAASVVRGNLRRAVVVALGVRAAIWSKT